MFSLLFLVQLTRFFTWNTTLFLNETWGWETTQTENTPIYLFNPPQIYAFIQQTVIENLTYIRHCASVVRDTSSVQSLSRVRVFATPWIAAHQASLSITISRSSLRLTSIESVMPSSPLILGHPLLLLPPVPASESFPIVILNKMNLKPCQEVTLHECQLNNKMPFHIVWWQKSTYCKKKKNFKCPFIDTDVSFFFFLVRKQHYIRKKINFLFWEKNL